MIEPTWLWADGLREVLFSIRDGRPPLASLEHDLHLLDVIAAARESVANRASVSVDSSFAGLDRGWSRRRASNTSTITPGPPTSNKARTS